MNNTLNYTNFNQNNYHNYSQFQNHNDQNTNNLQLSLHSNSQPINTFQQELNRYERPKKRGNTAYNSKLGIFSHFNPSGEINISPEKKIVSDKRVSLSSDLNNSLIRKIMKSNLHYVGFENKLGDNSCYINVILHFLYQFPSINIFLIKFYNDKKDNFIINETNSEDSFFFLLGKTLLQYQSIMSDFDNKGITILHTTELRKYLHLISNKVYKLNGIGDPVELLTFILEKINLFNKSDVHKDFFINLIEEIKCSELCENVKKNKYDEDNFIYQIYVNEIIRIIRNKDFKEFCHKLYYFSKANSSIEDKTCKKCGKKGKHILKYIGPKCSQYLLINCVWNIKKPELSDVLKFLYLLTLEGTLNDLFEYESTERPPFYNLYGLILYSGALCHYINVMYNMQKNNFILYNDDKIKELASIHDVYLEITAEQIKQNSEAFYYPVLLIYCKEIIYNSYETRKINEYSYEKFHHLEKECTKAKNYHLPLTEEEKRKNYHELERAQMRKMSADPRYCSNFMAIEEDFKYNKENSINMNINNHNSNNMSESKKRDIINGMDIEEDNKRGNIFGFNNDNNNNDDDEERKKNEYKRNTKKYGTDIKNNKNQKKGGPDFFWNIL